MENFRKNVPSLNALVALEAAVRNRSFTLAARELGVTQAAVSRQISILEDELGVQLFVRRHRMVDPMPSCLLLADTLSRCFSDIRQGVDLVRAEIGSQVVTIGTSVAFATLWLMPKLTEFRAQFPSVQIRLVSQDSRSNLKMTEVDVAVWFGTPPFDNGCVVGTRPDLIFAVCSPGVASRFETAEHFFRSPSDLIEQDTASWEWNSWKKWFAQAGLAVKVPRATLHCNHYTDALEAARAGQGIALGWDILVRRYIADGSLVRLGDRAVSPDEHYNVIVPSQRTRNGLNERVALWLLEKL